VQAATAAFAAAVEGNEVTVTDKATVRLPIYRINLILNPTFEYGLTGWAGFGGTTFALSAAQAFSGRLSMLVAWASSGAFGQGATTTLATQLGTVYCVSAMVYVPAGSPAVALTASGTVTGASAGAASTLTGQWQQIFVTFTALDASVTVGVGPAATATAGQQVYLDGWLAEANTAVAGTPFDGDNPGDENLAANPSFEQPILSGEWPAVACTRTRDTSWAMGGDYSVVLAPTSATTDNYISAGGDVGGVRTGLLPGHTYAVSASIRVPVALTGSAHADALRVVIRWRVGATYFEAASPAGPAAGGEARLAVTATIPATATEAFVRLYNGYTNTAANLVQWDAVLIREAATDTAFFGGRRITTNEWLGIPGQAVSRLNTDPYADTTLSLDSATVGRELTTDMPEGTRLISGYPAATATVVLSGMVDQADESKSAYWLLNPYDTTSPMYGNNAIGAPVELQAGVQPPGAAAELLTTFVGTVDDVQLDPATGAATLICIDKRNTLRPTVSLPSFAYQGPPFDNPGLTGGWVLDHLLRQSGVHSSPPPRDKCFFYASMNGSIYPDVQGTVDNTPATAYSRTRDTNQFYDTGWVGTPPEYSADTTPGVWHATVPYFPSTGGPIATANRPTLTTGGHMYFEGWVKPDPNIAAVHGGFYMIVEADPTLPSAPGMSVVWKWSRFATAATPFFNLARAAGATLDVALTGAIPMDGEFHHVSVFVLLTGSTTATVTITVDGVATTTNATGLVASGAEPAMVMATVLCAGWLDSVQLTNESAPVPYRNYYPTAYLDESLNPLVATVETAGQDSWSVIQQLAQAELGIAGFDEQGIFRFRNRTRILTGQAPARTVSSTASLKALALDVSQSSVVTHVTCPVNALQLSTQQVVWETSDVIRISPHKQASFIATTQEAVVGAAGADAGFHGTGSPPASMTYWRASRSASGTKRVSSGIDVIVTALSPTTLAVRIVNHNAFTVYMVSDNTLTDVSAGTPYVKVGGIFAAPPASGVLADSQWPAAADGGAASNPRGDITLALPDNPWLQDTATAQQLTDAILADLYQPRPVLSGVTVVGDPRLQLADRVTIVDPDGSHLADDVMLVGHTLTDSGSDWTSTLDVRAINAPGMWVMGVAGHSELGDTTVV
jgi:hypothetical protein